MADQLYSNNQGAPASALGLSYQELSNYPEAACMIGAAALRKGDEDLANRLFLKLGVLMLPSAANPWEGPAGDFWQEAFRRDPKAWLVSTIGALPKDKAKECAKQLLIAAAQNKAFECFDYLLSLGAARRSWTVFQSAYMHGGWRAAQRVKNPTSKEAVLMIENGCESYRCRSMTHDVEGLVWLSKFIEPGVMISDRWFKQAALSQSREVVLRAVELSEQLRLPLTADNALEVAMSLMVGGADQAALACVSKYQISVNQKIPRAEVSFPYLVKNAYARGINLPVINATLMECALLGVNADGARSLIQKGAQIPSEKRLEQMWDQMPKGSWIVDYVNQRKGPCESLRETVELEGSIVAPSSPLAKRGRGL